MLISDIIDIYLKPYLGETLGVVLTSFGKLTDLSLLRDSLELGRLDLRDGGNNEERLGSSCSTAVTTPSSYGASRIENLGAKTSENLLNLPSSS